jgi:hypothetical protein
VCEQRLVLGARRTFVCSALYTWKRSLTNRVVHFDIYVADVVPAIALYQTVFGLTIQKVEGIDCLLINTGEGEPGIDGGWASARPPLWERFPGLGTPARWMSWTCAPRVQLPWRLGAPRRIIPAQCRACAISPVCGTPKGTTSGSCGAIPPRSKRFSGDCPSYSSPPTAKDILRWNLMDSVGHRRRICLQRWTLVDVSERLRRSATPLGHRGPSSSRAEPMEHAEAVLTRQQERRSHGCLPFTCGCAALLAPIAIQNK